MNSAGISSGRILTVSTRWVDLLVFGSNLHQFKRHKKEFSRSGSGVTVVLNYSISSAGPGPSQGSV